MSKVTRPIRLVFASFLLILQYFTPAAGQDVDAVVKVTNGNSPSVEIKAKFADTGGVKNLWFLDEYAGVTGLLTNRFSSVDFRDKQGYLIARRFQTGDGGFSTANVGSVSYIVRLKPLPSRSAAAHTSWLNEDRGILMLDDLLPQGTKRARIRIEAPNGWKIVTVEPQIGPGVFDVGNIERAVFILGGTLREYTSKRNRFLTLSLNGEWHFSDDEALDLAEAILREYEGKIGGIGSAGVHIGIGTYPEVMTAGNWEGDTRGRTVTIMSSDMPFKNQSLQRLHEQLRHEIFHLWIPNGVNLTGNYDWFYEGFALYQSLKMGVAVNRIRFDDYLDTLSRAYDIETASSRQISLIDASANRWSGANTRVYTRGMLVAFLCDLAISQASKGKRSTDNILREVYSRHSGSAAPQDGNLAILAILRQRKELEPIINRYITGAERLDWNEYLRAAGLVPDVRDHLTTLTVTAKPSRLQKDLLDRLGYNSWRKLANSK